MKNLLITICIFTSINSIAQSNSSNFVYYGRTTGKLPALSYGMGEDRLGGAKMGYIDSNVLLKIVDSVKDMYTVQLSKYHTALIEKAYVKPEAEYSYRCVEDDWRRRIQGCPIGFRSS